MYDNWLGEQLLDFDNLQSMILGKPWGPFVYYDMFSFRGMFYFFYDGFFMNFAPWYYLILIFERERMKDWTYATIESEYHYVDMNRLFVF